MRKEVNPDQDLLYKKVLIGVDLELGESSPAGNPVVAKCFIATKGDALSAVLHS